MHTHSQTSPSNGSKIESSEEASKPSMLTRSVTYIHTHTYIHTYIHLHTYIHTIHNIHIYIYIYIYVYI